MDMRMQAKKAEQFRKLHHGPRMLLLPNAWDVASARILEECGHPAIATTSAGIAYSLGYPDGQRISRGEMLEVVGRVARAVRIPVTADLEAGYGTTPKDLAETVQAAIEVGVPANVLSAALYSRFDSQGRAEYADKLLSAMRLGFGGHLEKKS